ncbi:hypothetical protein [Endozoicomonas lisbonensis]|uniref:Uncharacterized protein n=1 Tax=Endozoicomonas lisbonensis TaxID=3120522 RepID=A0ABV2SD25_9GAMM
MKTEPFYFACTKTNQTIMIEKYGEMEDEEKTSFSVKKELDAFRAVFIYGATTVEYNETTDMWLVKIYKAD